MDVVRLDILESRVCCNSYDWWIMKYGKSMAARDCRKASLLSQLTVAPINLLSSTPIAGLISLSFTVRLSPVDSVTPFSSFHFTSLFSSDSCIPFICRVSFVFPSFKRHTFLLNCPVFYLPPFEDLKRRMILYL